MMSRPLCQVILHGVLVENREQIQPIQITPSEAEVELNDYRTADTFKLTFDWPELPFDPRVLEAVGVSIHLGPASADGTLHPSDENVVLTGFVDKPSTRAQESGIEVSLEGRDLTALFLDTQWSKTVKLGKLSATLREVVDQVPGAASMKIVLDGIDDVSLAVPGGRTRYTPEQSADAWTLITELVRMVGGVVFVRLDQIVVAGPRNLYPRDKLLTLVWGRDLLSLEYGTELRSSHNRGVRVAGRDPKTGKLNEVFYPPATAAAAKTRKKGDPQARKVIVHHQGRKVSQNTQYFDWLVRNVPAERLEQIAKNMWEAQSRHGVQGKFETSRLTAVDDQTPIWELRHSDAVRILTPAALAGSITSLPPAAAVAQLTQGPLRLRREVAESFVRSARSLAAADAPWYIQRAMHRWTQESGYQLSCDFINFVTISP